MKLNCSRICVVLAAVILYFLPPSLHATNFKIRPVVLTGDQAPEGGAFTSIGTLALNSPGKIAFVGSTASSRGIYLASDGTIQRVIKAGDTVIIPEMLLSGVLVKKEPTVDPNVVFYEFTDGHRFSCGRTRQVAFGSFPQLFINDSGDIVFGDASAFSLVPPVLFSGGTLTDSFGCPGVTHLIFDLSGHPATRVEFFFTSIAGINNTGTIAFNANTFEPFPTIRFRDFPFLSTGGMPTLLPVEGVVVNINDSGDMLVGTNEGIFFNSTPIALIGGPADQGRTFSIINETAFNNAGEVVFTAFLSNFRRAIFHWANGILTLLRREFDPMPAGGTFFDFFGPAINDNGDIAFNSGNRIFLLNANGGLSEVARPGNAVFGGGLLTVVGEHRLNNKGQIAFRGVLSNGKSGIFLASPGLETEFVDPVPDLLAGPVVTSDTTMLAKNGRVVTGIAADGTARVVVRVKTGQVGTTEFSLVDENGVALPPSNFNGSLSSVGDALGSGSVSVPATDVEGFGPMAFAAYHAPMDFSTSPNSKEAGDPDRKISIKIMLRTATGDTVESTETIKIVRPPVVLVHGLWGSPGSWDRFDPLRSSSIFSINLADYEETNARELSLNSPNLIRQTKKFVEDYKLVQQVAAVRADVVTHSMGGLLVRMLPNFEGAFFRNDNFGRGDVHKLINIATPHFGSELARLLRNDSCVSGLVSLSGNLTDQGAIEDLVPRSRALDEINLLSSPLLLHNVVGTANQQQVQDSENAFWFRTIRFLCPNSRLRLGLNAVHLNRPHDLVVDALSQQGSLSSITTGLNVIHTRISGLFVGIGELEASVISQESTNLPNLPLAPPTFTQAFPSRGP